LATAGAQYTVRTAGEPCIREEPLGARRVVRIAWETSLVRKRIHGVLRRDVVVSPRDEAEDERFYQALTIERMQQTMSNADVACPRVGGIPHLQVKRANSLRIREGQATLRPP
jgi:hypothetical protein